MANASSLGVGDPKASSIAAMQWRGRVARHKAQHAHSRAERTQWQAESERILLRCLRLDPLDARSYVALGKLYMGQQRMDEAARLYDDGCAATGVFNIVLYRFFHQISAKMGSGLQ